MNSEQDANPPPAAHPTARHRHAGLLACSSLAIANMVGTGVFTSLGFQAEALHSPFLLLSLWIVGGVAAFCGAMCYAELSAMLPASGGEYHFLKEIYHPAVGFMAAVVSLTVGFSAPLALAAMACGKYLHAAMQTVPASAVGWIAILSIATAHAFSVRTSGVFQIFVTGTKLALIACFLVGGFAGGHSVELAPQSGDLGIMAGSSYAVALMYVMYSYWGWNATAYITSEVRNPQRTVPAALLVATIFVTILYVLLNYVFLGSAPLSELAGKIEVGKIAAVHLFGEIGGRVMSAIIAIGLLSAMSAMTWAGPRVMQAVGRDFSSLSWLAKANTGGIPKNALLAQTLLVLAMFFTGSFEAILLYATFALTLCSSLAVLGVVVMRIRRPVAVRPFRCWGYPATPAIYLLITLSMLVYAATQRPWQAAAGTATIIAGAGLYFLSRSSSRVPASTK